MPFSVDFLENASRTVEAKFLEDDFSTIKLYIMSALQKVAEKEPRFDPSQVEVYIHGSYANGTNIHFESALEIMVEVKKTALYDPADVKETDYRVLNNYFIDMRFDYSPKDFRKMLFEALGTVTAQKCSESDTAIRIPAFGKMNRDVEITPCFTFPYYDEKGGRFKGVLLYDHSISGHFATFPRLHSQNVRIKDIAGMGNFKKIVRLFKTLYCIDIREFQYMPPGTARGYFIECLLFNVPNRIYKGNSFAKVFSKVLNYLLNCETGGFVCANLVWRLFGTTSEFWKPQNAQNFVKGIRDLWLEFPERRTLIE